jgi:gliding motility-associated-like protein
MTEIRHLWYFGDGNSSTQANPVHVYDNPGTYTVEHYAYTYDGCVDSSYTIYPDIITIYPVPQSGLIWQSKITDIYDPVFYVSNNSSGHTSTKTILPDGQRIDNMSEATVTMRDTGNFLVYHISYNEYNCVDTLIDTIRVDDPFTLYIPNAFSPNGDGMNDLFTFKMSGISSIVIEIYNRWGEIVYQSTDPKAGWDGTILNSEKKAPGGVYAYVLKARVKKGGYQEVRTGPITLLR